MQMEEGKLYSILSYSTTQPYRGIFNFKYFKFLRPRKDS